MAKIYEYVLKLKDQASDKLDSVSRSAKIANSGLNSFSSTAEKVGSVMKRITGSIFNLKNALVSVAAGAGVTGIISLGARAEQTGVSFEVMLKSADRAKTVIASLNKFSAVTPFEPEQVIQAGKGLLAFGVQSKNLIPTLQKIGDISAGTGKDFNELTTIYGKARIAGNLYGDDINSLVEAGIPIMGEFAKILGVSESQVKKLASEGKVQFSALEQAFTNLTGKGGLYFDLMKKQSETVAGKFSTLKGNLVAFGTEIGTALLPAAGSGIDYLINNLDGIKTAFGNIFTVLEPVGVAVGGLFSALGNLAVKIGLVKSGSDPLASTINAVASALGFVTFPLQVVINSATKLIGVLPIVGQFTVAFSAAVTGAVTVFALLNPSVALFGIRLLAMEALSVAASVATGIMTAGQWLLNAALNANPIGLVVTGLGLLAAGLVYAYNKSETFRNVVNKSFQFVLTPINYVYESVMSVVGAIKQALEALGLISKESDRNIKKVAGISTGVKQGSASEKIIKAAKKADTESTLKDAVKAPETASINPVQSASLNKGISDITGGGQKQTNISFNIKEFAPFSVSVDTSIDASIDEITRKVIEAIRRGVNGALQTQTGA